MAKQDALDSTVDVFNQLFEERHGTGYAYADHTYWWYRNGAWSSMSDADRGSLDTMLYDAAAGSGTEYARDKSQLWETIKIHGIKNAPPKGFDYTDDDTGPYLVCRNVTLDLGAPHAEMAIDHDPEHYATCYVDADYNPAAKCRHFLDAMRRALDDHPDPKGVIHFLQEWFGVNIVGEAYKRKVDRNLRHALILYGQSGTGKSTVANAFVELLGGQKAVSAMSMEQLGSRFGPSGLIGKRALVSSDGIRTRTRMNTNVFKPIVTGEPITVERKNEQLREFIFHGGIMFTTNALPEVEDEGDAVYKRLVVIVFDRLFNKEDSLRDFGGKDATTFWRETGEFSGILNWALEGFDRVHRNKGYTIPPSCADAAEQFRIQNDPAYAVVRSTVIPDPKSYLSITAMTAMLMHHAMEADSKRLQYRRTMSELTRLVRAEFGTEASTVVADDAYLPTHWKGLALNDDGKRLWMATKASGVLKSQIGDMAYATSKKI